DVEKDPFKGRNTYEQPFFGGNRGTPLEVTSKTSVFDLPKAYLDYNSGPLWLRFGNQQIAWGEALFFRVSDTVNGLDLRRHLFGVGAEEYSDSRVPSLGIRGSYRANENWEIEAFTQQFQPSLLPGENSPYNLIPAQFIVDEKTGFDDVKNKWNFGGRVSGKVGDYGIKAFAVRRYNPDGQYKWTPSNQYTGSINGTTFVMGTGVGVYSAAEWMYYAAHSRLNGLATTQVNEAPFIAATTALGVPGLAKLCGAPSYAVGNVQVDTASMNCLLDSFFTPAAGGGVGNLRGTIRRDYPQESVLGFSVNKVFEGAPDTLMDQLIGRFELSYTPNKKFTETSLSQQYIVHDETIFAFIFEKYHKFSQDFPATYFVAQWMHRSHSDIFGRALERMNAVPGSYPTGQTGGADYFVLAFQQPSPTLEWRFDASVLTDFHGGYFLQPGFRWKPNKAYQVDLYANILKSYGAQTNRNFVQGIENNNEIFTRITYAF
ncbi:MAG: DUF1302 family protein, partial [Proteobacteria bacterium]|nr:DUF1302 family protein [Pseudomonadota bacterium]